MSNTGPTRNPSASNRANPLFRGAGCHHCRSRKVKCDAAKPHCTRCVEQATTDKCLYDEVKKSKLTLEKEQNAALKEQIARLERQLAHMGASASDSNLDQGDKPQGHRFEEDDTEVDGDGYQDEPSHPQPDQASITPATQDEPFGPFGPFGPSEHYVPLALAYAQNGKLSGSTTDYIPASWTMERNATELQTPALIADSFESPSQPMPQLQPHQTPASPGQPFRQSSTHYPQGADFDSWGIYQGGQMAPYDAYEGARNPSSVVIHRAKPSPPVFGVDLVMNFFQHWKSEQPMAYSVAPNFSRALGYDGGYPGSESALIGGWWELDDLPVHHRNYLIELFLPFRKQVGLEIWVPDFLASLHLPPKKRPHPGFMWMIYTFAASYSGRSELEEQIPAFLERARRNLKQSHTDGDRLFHCIQGYTMLAAFLLLQGKINEGSLEANVACHIAVTCGLHKISSAEWVRPVAPPRSSLRIRQVDYHLEPPASAREHGERIAAFWQLMLVDYTTAASTGLPAYFRDDGNSRSRVETIFPRPLEEYMNGTAAVAPYATLRDIFAPRFISQHPPDIVSTLQVKATALLERAVRLGTMWRDGVDVSFDDPDKFRSEYNTVFNAIKHFRSYLPPIRQPESESQLSCTTNGLVWERLYPHFMTLNAEIQLYYVIGDTDPAAYQRCLDSSRAVEGLIEQLTDPEISQIGVMFGHCFTSTAHILQRELKIRRTQHDEPGMAHVNHELDVVVNALKVLGKEHHLVAVQFSRTLKSRTIENQI